EGRTRAWGQACGASRSCARVPTASCRRGLPAPRARWSTGRAPENRVARARRPASRVERARPPRSDPCTRWHRPRRRSASPRAPSCARYHCRACRRDAFERRGERAGTPSRRSEGGPSRGLPNAAERRQRRRGRCRRVAGLVGGRPGDPRPQQRLPWRASMRRTSSFHLVVLAVATGIGGTVSGCRRTTDLAGLPPPPPTRPDPVVTEPPAPSAVPRSAPPPEVVTVLERIDAARLRATVDRLAGFGTRHTLSDPDHPERGIGAARRYIEAEMRSHAVPREGAEPLRV